MHTDLVKPCEGCPFRKDGTGVKLHPLRVREIARITGKGGAFICHKTVTHDDEDERAPTHREQHCAGALMYALNVGDRLADAVVQIRTAHAPGHYEKLKKGRGTVYGSLKEWLAKGTIP